MNFDFNAMTQRHKGAGVDNEIGPLNNLFRLLTRIVTDKIIRSVRFARVIHLLKSFLPRISRISPMGSRLPIIHAIRRFRSIVASLRLCAFAPLR
jgi:hypothetical protein